MSVDLADPETRRDITARREWGCPRPDKTHYLTEEHAQQQLTWNSHKRTHDHTATVYHCPCGGWVWGRRRK